MALSDDDAIKHRRKRKLYLALMRREESVVIELCRHIPEGPLHIVSIHKDTVLHMATYSKRQDLVLNLLEELPENESHKLRHQNDMGNTILHEAATSNLLVPAARQILGRAPGLLSMGNFNGEIATFCAARYGKYDMFWFLDGQVDNNIPEAQRDVFRKVFYQRTDGTTILHISVLTEHFGLALSIAKKYEFLVSKRDGDNMTALQLLACKSSAFEYGRFPTLFKRLFDCCVSSEDASVTEEVEPRRRVTLWGTIQNLKEKYESAMKLAKFLIERDISWEDTDPPVDEGKPKIHNYGEAYTASEGQGKKIAETPLFLATKSGCKEIVEAILKRYPQAIEHIDHDGRNILHVAIKYRQIQIFDIVEKMEIPMTRLLRKIDKNGNTILHMVGTKAEDCTTKDMRSPALLLQEDMLLFERVKKISAPHFINHFNLAGQTAEKLFAENNAKLWGEAKEWLKRTAENCSIVAVLIATVAFAAAYTIPGGPNQNTGYPVLLNQPFFVIFTLTDVLSLTFALTSVITFLSILTSPFQLGDFRQSLPKKLMLGITLLIFAVSMMMLAFAATIILTINNKEQWTEIVLYIVAFLPVTIFVVSYSPFYFSLFKTLKYVLEKIWEAIPRSTCLATPQTPRGLATPQTPRGLIETPIDVEQPAEEFELHTMPPQTPQGLVETPIDVEQPEEFKLHTMPPQTPQGLVETPLM